MQPSRKNKIFIGQEMLTNKKDGRHFIYRIIFAGAEKLENNKWKVNCIYEHYTGNRGTAANMYVIVEPGDEMKYAKYLGVNEIGQIQKSTYQEEKRVFYPINFIKFIAIEQDQLEIAYFVGEPE